MSDEQVGHLLDHQEVALAQFLKALFKHKTSLPHHGALPHGQRLQHVLVLPHRLAQQTEAHPLATSLTEHHQTPHTHLVYVNVQQLAADLVTSVVEIEEGAVVAQEEDLFESA
jgi:hypothetical protein